MNVKLVERMIRVKTFHPVRVDSLVTAYITCNPLRPQGFGARP